MKGLVCFILVLLILPHVVSAENVLSVYLEVYKNNTVLLQELKVKSGTPTQYITPGSYKLQILNAEDNVIFEKSINLNFMLMTDPPTPIDSSPLNMNVLYAKEMIQVKLLHNEDEIFSKGIELCNDNGDCEEFESYLTCSSDCPLDLPDGVCIKNKDGVCDPDCSAGADPDCETTTTTTKTTKSTTTTTTPPKTYLPIYVYAVIIVIIIAVVAVFLYKIQVVR